MPQLDSLTYFTQFFWFVCIFLLLYVFIENVVLPHTAIILKVRNALKFKKGQTVEKKNNNIELLSLSNLNTIEKFSNNFNVNGKNWLYGELDSLKQNQLSISNKMYTDNIGLILLKKKINNKE